MKNTVSSLNAELSIDAKAFVSRCEADYYQQLDALAQRVYKNHDIKVIMIAGPSGSGKTTSSHILCDIFLKHGVSAQVISLDNFYLNRPFVPRDEDGMPDFESVYSIDLQEIDRCFSQLVQKGKCFAPKFDFHTGARSENRKEIELGENGLLIVEGLHALNPLVYGSLPQSSVFKLFISIGSSVYRDDGTELMTGEQLRFCRRMSRDYIYRNSTPQNTLQMWRDVRAGEKKWITPFKDRADASIDTFHPYETCLFSKRVGKMLRSLSEGISDSLYADRTADALAMFLPLKTDLVPQDSLLREFIEGGKYKNVT